MRLQLVAKVWDVQVVFPSWQSSQLPVSALKYCPWLHTLVEVAVAVAAEVALLAAQTVAEAENFEMAEERDLAALDCEAATVASEDDLLARLFCLLASDEDFDASALLELDAAAAAAATDLAELEAARATSW